jgi:hypothetical protein
MKEVKSMLLEKLVQLVKRDLKVKGRYDMRTFDYHYFEHQNGEVYDVVEFFIYEKSSRPNRSYVVMSYDLFTGKRLFKLTTNGKAPSLEKRVVGFEREGQVHLFSEENSESKVFSTLFEEKVTKLKKLPENEETAAYKPNKLLQEIDEVEHQMLSRTKATFEGLRDFVHYNI